MAWQGPATAVGSDADRRQVVGSADHALGARVSVHPPAGPDWRWLAPGAIVAIAAGIGGVWWLALGVCGLLGWVTVRGYRQRSKVTIFEQGLEVVRREGTRRYPWDQLEALVDTERRVLGSGLANSPIGDGCALAHPLLLSLELGAVASRHPCLQLTRCFVTLACGS